MERKEGFMMKFTKILSGMLAATLVASAFGGLTVANAAVNTTLPYTNDFSTAADASRVFYQDISTKRKAADGTVEEVGSAAATGTVSIEEGMLVQRNVTGWASPSAFPSRAKGNGLLTFEFAPVNSGILVVELRRAFASEVVDADRNITGFDGTLRVFASNGTKIADIQADGRGDFGKPWVNTAFISDVLDGNNWMYARTIKYEINFDTDKYKIYFDNVLKTAGTGATAKNEFEFSASNVAKVEYQYSQNGEAVDDIKIYKKVAATQTVSEIDMFVNDRLALPSNGLNITAGNVRDFTFESDNTSVATVAANGLIRARAVGTANITVKNEISGINFKYKVNVCTEATSITIDGDSHNVVIGTTKTLTYTTPEGTAADAVVWSSSNPSIVSVNSATGEVTGIAKGTATITASCFGGTVSDTCTVNVVVPVSGLTITGTTDTLEDGESTVLGYAVTPFDANITDMKWRSGNHYVATVNNSGVVTAVGVGHTEIYLSMGNLFASYPITVNGTESERRTPLISFADVKGSFSDIADISWAQSAIQSVAASGIMTPDSEYVFGAKRNITRDELVSVVIKTLALENETADEPVEKTFDDVDESNPYYAEIMKAVELGIIAGINETSFAPKDDITRQDLALVVFKALEVADVDTVEGRLDFNDKDSIATYAQKAVRVLSKMNVMVGKNNSNFDPFANTTRAEVAVISEKITAIR
ncbi:MAG: S-layer homology domain-containing protein [Eubacteriales bacterium]|nr:S-layer homology domain-containing protein [Eubacteriales bacterium]